MANDPNTGQVLPPPQEPVREQNRLDAIKAEQSINNCLGAGWGTVLGPAQGRANPKGVGSIPSGDTDVRLGINRRPPPPRKGR